MTPQIPGADSLIEWFGQWPSFHDGEILSLHLNRGGRSHLRISTAMRDRHAIVLFEFAGISDLELQGDDADRQNVIARLSFTDTEKGHRLEMSPCYGMAGYIVASDWTVRLEHGDLFAG